MAAAPLPDRVLLAAERALDGAGFTMQPNGRTRQVR
jgi:hypothetical protein